LSGQGAPSEANLEAKGKTIAIVQSLWHQQTTDSLSALARETCEKAGAQVVTYQVMGALELPLAAQRAIKAGADGVVATGLVLKGQTPHFDFVAATTIDALVGVSLATNTPVGVAVLTCNNQAEADARSGDGVAVNAGAQAAQAVISSINQLPSS
jgi:6,7-dimethyl-8-ribityllumazine synthase